MASFAYIYILLAIIIKFVSCQDCALEPLWPSEVPVEMRLKTKILKCYDAGEPPNSNTTKKVEVEVAYIIQMLQFDHQEEVLTIYSWSIMEWEDARLKWDVNKYKGIKTTVLNFYEIWTPELKAKNYNIEDSDSIITMCECLANNTGHVRCIQSNKHSLMCSSSMKDWPYDRKHCNLKMDDDSWSRNTVTKNIVFTKFKLLSFEDTYSAWRLIDSQGHLHLTGDYQASVEFVLERVADGFRAALVVPAFVMSVLTIITFLLDVNDNIRLGMLYTSLFSHYQFLTEVTKSIPKHSADAPKILLFITGSMTMTLIIIVLTLTLRYLCSCKSTPPVLITSINYFVLNGYTEYLVFPRWSVGIANITILDSISQQAEWLDFSNIINSIVFIVSVITYIVMYSIYLPREDYIPTTN